MHKTFLNSTIALVQVLAIFTYSVESDKGTVVTLRNRAEACAQNTQCRKLDFGSDVVQGDSLKTFEQSRLVVRFGSGSRAELGPNSVLVLAEVQKNGKKTFARWGEFDFEVKNKDSKGRFQVRTPVAVAGAEGTRFKVWVDQNGGASAIELYEGSLKIDPTDGKGQSIKLKPGQKIQVNAGQALPSPSNISESSSQQKNTGTPEQSSNEQTSPPEAALLPPITPPPASVVPAKQPERKGTLRIDIQGVP